MYGGIGMSASSLHRESTDSLMGSYYVIKIRNVINSTHIGSGSTYVCI